MAKKDYYEVLGVSKDATDAQIKKAYRRHAMKHHPDRHPGDKSAEARFKEINEAYGVVGDPGKRQEYDMRDRVSFASGEPFSGGVGGFNIRDSGFGMGGFDDVFSEFLGRARQNVPVKGAHIEYPLDIDFMGAAKGTEVKVSVPRQSGMERITVKIPAGVKDGSKVRVAGKGRAGMSGGPHGDLFIDIRVKPHPYFRRKKNDIYLDVPVTIGEAALGANIKIPTIDGHTTIKIPPGTQGGQKFRIKSMGMPNPRGRVRGDQYVFIKVAVPQKLKARAKKIIEELQEINPYEPRRNLW